jgi:lipocalin
MLSLFTLFIVALWYSLVLAHVSWAMGIEAPRAVSRLDTDAFMGRWYQTHTSLVPTMTVEKNAYCVCADYSYYDVSSTEMLSLNYLK